MPTTASDGSHRAENRPKLTVFGTGCLGATHAVCMAELGHEVLGKDVDVAKIAKLSAGQVPFYEPGLKKLYARI